MAPCPKGLSTTLCGLAIETEQVIDNIRIAIRSLATVRSFQKLASGGSALKLIQNTRRLVQHHLGIAPGLPCDPRHSSQSRDESDRKSVV